MIRPIRIANDVFPRVRKMIRPIRSHRGVWVSRQNSHLLSFIGACSLRRPLQHQTRIQSLFMCFWGERRLGDRLRRAGSHGKVGRKNRDAIFPSYLPMRSCAPQPNPQSSLTPKTHKKRLGTSLLQHRFADIQREKFFSKSFSRKKVKNISEIRVE